MTLDTKRVAIGVTGGIAAYKSCEVIRSLRETGAEVRVCMTESAKEFVSELTFATLSERPVLSSLFSDNGASAVAHIDLARWCDLLLICPATANIIGKVAGGIADDAVSTTVIATRSEVIFCPAMNSAMWKNPAVQANVKKLREFGYTFVAPEWGALATQAEGEGLGRLAAPERIVQVTERALLGSRELEGKKVLVTAGPTKEALDPVRFIGNHSSGKMGFALAEAAKLKGADVVLISGVKPQALLEDIKLVEVSSAEQMKAAIEDEYADTDILLMAAAIADYKPKRILSHKLKKEASAFALELEKTPDILAELGRKKTDCLHVGFALETDDGLSHATKKLHAKNLDLIVLNNPLESGAGFAVETNVVTIITAGGEVERLPKLPKIQVAKIIVERVLAALQSKYRIAAAV